MCPADRCTPTTEDVQEKEKEGREEHKDREEPPKNIISSRCLLPPACVQPSPDEDWRGAWRPSNVAIKIKELFHSITVPEGGVHPLEVLAWISIRQELRCRRHGRQRGGSERCSAGALRPRCAGVTSLEIQDAVVRSIRVRSN